MRKLIAGAAAGALLLSAAGPAQAGGWHHHHHDDGVDDIVGGALVIGGIAAIASAITQGNRQKQDAAVAGCSTEAENRTGGRVAEIRHVGKNKGYYNVEGWLDGGDDGGPRRAFACTIRNGSIYSFRTDGDGA